MSKELEIWQFAAGRLKQGESVMVLIVAESSGSSPGRQGFKMMVAGDELCGSIGGGVMEIALVEQAKLKIKNEKLKIETEIIEQVHRKNAPDSSGMICSGKQSVVLFGLNSNHLKTVQEIIHALRNHETRKLRMTNDELRISGVEENGFDHHFEKSGGNEFIYVETLGLKNKLFIVGGGHCALALSELMSKMDFYISLFDDRVDLNTLAKNEFVHSKTVIDSYENIGEFIESGNNNYVVVMTLGYKFDEIVIRKLIDKNFKYFGVLGSRAKMKTLLKNLEREGVSGEKLNRLRTPVGLPIASRTPEEIAVSIAAEIIAVKNRGNRKSC
jgi:xanthine dehydrogenase accessory factor